MAGAAGAACTFSIPGQSGVGTFQSPFLLTGVHSGDTITISCTGLPPTTNGSATSVGTIEASPLAVSASPFSLAALAGDADINHGNITGAVTGSGTFNGTQVVGTTGGGGSAPFTPGLAGTYAGDPLAVCPPSQAQINDGLGMCVLSVANISATAAKGAVPTASDFMGEALLDFAGQPSPQVPPTISSVAPAAPGHSATLSDAPGAGTFWWAGGWWGGGYPGGSLTPAPFDIPNSNVFVNGVQATKSSVKVTAPVYCVYGGASATSCNQTGNPGTGHLFPAALGGSVAIPSNASGGTAAIQIFEPNNWGSAFAGNNTSNHNFPARDLTATGTIGLTHLGYWEMASDGGQFSFGTANFFGSMGGKPLVKPMVGMAPTSDGQGYWEVASDGGLFSFGDAHYYGSMGGKPLDQPIVGMAATPDGQGYWEVASDGGLFSFGDAHYYGSMGGKPLDQPIVGMAATPDGKGYWEVASDGGLFGFGDAKFHGSMGGKPLDKPIVAMAATPDGGGYWEVASDGGLFSFGDAHFYGSMGGKPLNKPIVDMWTNQTGNGYWEVASDGGIFSFGAAKFLGSMGGKPLNEPIVAGAFVPITSLTLAKSTTWTSYGAPGQAAGAVVPYKYVVTNTGSGPVENVGVTDSNTSVSCPSSTLAAGASETCTGNYTVTQSEVDAGNPLINSATATARTYQGLDLSSSASTVSLPNHATSSITMAKNTTSTGFAAATDTIPYTYLVTNTGTTTLSSVAVTDSAINPFTVSQGGTATPITVMCPDGTLAPTAHETCTSTYTVTQSDVDSGQACPSGCYGSVTNTAQAKAQTPGGATVSTPDQSLTVESTGATASATFSFSSPTTGYTASDQTIEFDYHVTNTGTISIFVGFNDSLGLSPNCPDNGNGLAPGDSETCVADYTTTTADVTAGSVTDMASLAGADFDFGNPVTSSTQTVTVNKT